MDREETAVGQASPRDKPERKVSVPATPATLRPPMLEKDDTAVTGALKHHLKNPNKRQKIGGQLNQEQQSYWTTRYGISGADYEVLVPAANHRGQMCSAGLALHHPAADPE